MVGFIASRSDGWFVVCLLISRFELWMTYLSVVFKRFSSSEPSSGTCPLPHPSDLRSWADPHLRGQFGKILWDNSNNANDIIIGFNFFGTVRIMMHSQCSPDKILAVIGWDQDFVTLGSANTV